MMRFLPVNLDALLVELDDLPQTLALLASLQAEPIAGIEELVPAARTLLVRYRPTKVSRAALIERIGTRSLAAQVEREATLIEIPVDYSGEDLDEVAQMLGLSRSEVIRRHTGSEYTVAFTGFAPGFAYLSGGDPLLNVPRRSTPRTRIPAGAVGLAGPFSGVYPQASPGGWQIIGVTDTPMWDLERELPALLQPGFRVRFIDRAGRPARSSPAPAPRPAAAPVAIEPGGAALEIRSAGLQALFQDTGRHGQARQGVSASGAMDQRALRAANRLVGNASDAACIEIAYGGFAIAPVLGSRSTDTLARVGPAPIAAGDVLPVCPVARGAIVGLHEQPPADLPRAQQTVVLDVVMGPRTDWFTPEAVALLASQVWRATPQSNRVGLRLAGEQALARANPAELPSEGTALGALQVPPSGQPVLFLADHPLTGGYPVIGAVATYHLDRAGQIPIGASVRFNPIQPFGTP
jgi:KipI family sensor histidine kinase inhibitor